MFGRVPNTPILTFTLLIYLGYEMGYITGEISWVKSDEK